MAKLQRAGSETEEHTLKSLSSRLSICCSWLSLANPVGSQETREPDGCSPRNLAPGTQNRVDLEGKVKGPDRRSLYVVYKESEFYMKAIGSPGSIVSRSVSGSLNLPISFFSTPFPILLSSHRVKTLSSLHLLYLSHLSEACQVDFIHSLSAKVLMANNALMCYLFQIMFRFIVVPSVLR